MSGRAALADLASPRATRWLGLALTVVSIAGLVVLLRDRDPAVLVEPLAGARLHWLVIAMGLALAVEVAKTVRWQLLLGLRLSALPSLLALVLNARLLNVLWPVRAGDVWRAAAAASQERCPLVAAGGSILLEKGLDGLVLAGLGLAVVGRDRLALPGWLPALLGLSLGLAGALLASGPGRQLLRRFAASLRHLWSVPAAGSLAGLTLAGLGLGLLANLAVLEALAIPVDLLLGLVMLVAGYAAGLVPAGPGRLGIYELALTAPLVGAGLAPPAAFGAAVALHAVLLASLLVGGLVAVSLSLVTSLAQPSSAIEERS